MRTTLLRNMYAAMAALFIATFALPQQAHAEDYGLKIGGKAVTSDNYGDISSSGGFSAVKSGKVSYDPSTKTLTLENAVINVSGNEYGIVSEVDGLTIRSAGENRITAGGFSAIMMRESSCTLVGGSLKLSGSSYGIYVWGPFREASATIKDCVIDSDGSVGDNNRRYAKVTVENSTLTIKSKGYYGCIQGLKELNLIGCEITQPSGASFDASLYGVALNGQLVESTVQISPKVSGIVILSEGFEKLSLPAGWTNIDADGQDNGWKVVEFEDGNFFQPHSGQYCISSASYINYVGAQTPDNWLVTPLLNLPSGGVLSFWVCAQDYDYVAEKYAVYVSTTGNDKADFTQKLHEETLTKANNQGNYKEVKLNLPAGTRYVAFRHYDCTDQFWINIDDVVIQSEPTPVLGFAVIDEVKKPILSYKYFDEGNNSFILRFYLSADEKEIAQVEGDRNLHTGKDIDLTKRESLHEGWYWCVAYATDFISWDNCHRVFIGLGNPNSDAPVFTAGTLRIDGDPAGTFTVSLKNGRITTDTTWGDGKEHTVSINCSNDPTGIETVTADASVKRQGTYNLQGVKLNTAFDRLPAGIYIVDGKKVVKR